jgi:plastocyanin
MQWAVMAAATMASAADWGTLKGRFVFAGSPPEPVKLQINKDIEFCGKHEPRAEKLVVHREDRGIANVVLWLDVKAGDKVAIHPAFETTATAQIKLANRGCRFDPHICVIRTGQSLLIENPDQVDHNTAAGLDKNDPFNALTPLGKTSERPRFKHAERLPAQVQCSIHPWMTGWLVVKDHPYVAVTDEHGRFELKNLPAGEHTFVVWHELPGYVESATRGGQSEVWKRGKVAVRVVAGETDFGEVRLSADVLK